jgi:hypothetical protein
MTSHFLIRKHKKGRASVRACPLVLSLFGFRGFCFRFCLLRFRNGFHWLAATNYLEWFTTAWVLNQDY